MYLPPAKQISTQFNEFVERTWSGVDGSGVHGEVQAVIARDSPTGASVAEQRVGT